MSFKQEATRLWQSRGKRHGAPLALIGSMLGPWRLRLVQQEKGRTK